MCKKLMLIVTIVLCVLIVGCNRGSFKASPVIEGQPSPHQGYNLGPDSWMNAGDTVKVTGIVIWVEGTDPEAIFE